MGNWIDRHISSLTSASSVLWSSLIGHRASITKTNFQQHKINWPLLIRRASNYLPPASLKLQASVKWLNKGGTSITTATNVTHGGLLGRTVDNGSCPLLLGASVIPAAWWTRSVWSSCDGIWSKVITGTRHVQLIIRPHRPSAGPKTWQGRAPCLPSPLWEHGTYCALSPLILQLICTSDFYWAPLPLCGKIHQLFLTVHLLDEPVAYV